jgi:putative ABC transport system substrate-binding protein
MKRREALVVLAAGLAAPLAALAQQRDKVRRIGILSARARHTPQNPEPYFPIFVQAMRELGYVEGKNLAIEWRYADGKHERLADLAVELVQAKVEVIVTHFSGGALAAHGATRTIPIVSLSLGDPVGFGMAASLGRPGGNVTGLVLIVEDIYPKQVELLHLMLPKAKRVAVLSNQGNRTAARNLKTVRETAQQMGIDIMRFEAGTPAEADRALATMAREQAEAVLVFTDSVFIGFRRHLTEGVARHRLPSMFYAREDARAGALMSYGQDLPEFYRLIAGYAARILKGAKPGELPIEQPRKIHFAINRGTAKTLGIVVPQDLLLRADELID